MESLLFLLGCLLLSWLAVHHFLSLRQRRVSLPPGPAPLPIIGNLLCPGDKPHISLARLAQTHGPIMCLELGRLKTVVISSPALAKEVLQKNDGAFSYRAVGDAVRAHRHHEFSMVFLPPHAVWRNLRKITNSTVFSRRRMDASSHLRREKIDELLSQIGACCREGVAVEVGQAAFNTTLNLLSNTFFSEDLADPILTSSSSSRGKEFKELMWQILEEVGKANLCDCFPFFKWLDLQGIRGRMDVYLGKLLGLFDVMIDKRLSVGVSSDSGNDVLDALLNIIGQDNSEGFNREFIKHMMLDLLIAGSDTTSSTIEWAMTELLLNPFTMTKVQEELQKVIGRGNPVKEEDISKLPYLQAVVKESFRLHPSVPFLVPRKVANDVTLSGYLVPKDSQVLINIWAVGRDHSVWEDANSFRPERFLESNIDVKGQDFQLIPFGGGRRICPGIPLAMRMLPMLLASLIHWFDWKLEDGLTEENMNMEEKFGFTLQKAEPLRAIPLSKS